jgi:hypothetical protein
LEVDFFKKLEPKLKTRKTAKANKNCPDHTKNKVKTEKSSEKNKKNGLNGQQPKPIAHGQ